MKFPGYKFINPNAYIFEVFFFARCSNSLNAIILNFKIMLFKIDQRRCISKKIYFVFDAFRVSLFALNQSEILLSSELAKL